MPSYQGSYRANQKHHTLQSRALIAPWKVRSSTDQLNSLPPASTIDSNTPKNKVMNVEEEKQPLFLAGIEMAANQPGMSCDRLKEPCVVLTITATESPAVTPHQPANTDIGMEDLQPSGETRRRYNKEARQLLPFHHEPAVRIDRRWRSTSAIDALLEINLQINQAADREEKDGTDERLEINRLCEAERFVLETERLREWDESPHNRSLEDRMEILLKEFGYDKTKPTDYELRRMRMKAMKH
ncbi:MAG: hypothetical protein Q9212_002125 [Teloschistes hypoglaucus]